MTTTTQELRKDEAVSEPERAEAEGGAGAQAQRQAAWALYLMVFAAGAILMGVEIAGSRVLAPSFGTSIFVWGSLIGLVMGSMALGFWLGGMLADVRPSVTVVASLLSLAGLYVFGMIPYLGPYICEHIGRQLTSQMGGPLTACIVLFAVPGLLMATVTPFAVKMVTRRLAGVGGVTGRLFALNTIGSIAGTLATTFFFIPTFTFTRTLQGLGVALVATGVLSLVLWRRALGGFTREDRHGVSFMALLLLALLAVWLNYPVKPWIANGQRLLHYVESEYHDIAVTEEIIYEGNGYLYAPNQVVRYLKFNENIESAIYPYKGKYQNAVGYTDLLHLPLIWNAQPKRMLVVGGGGGIVPTQYLDHYPSMEQVDVLELDDVVRQTAQDHFMMTRDERLRFHIGDARANLSLVEGPYDVIVLDAYSSGGQIPFHLMTWEFLKEVKAKLAPGGVLASNIIAAIENDNSSDDRNADLLHAEFKTLRHPPEAPLFKQVYVFPRVYDREGNLRGYESETRNVVLLATDEEAPKSLREIVDAAKKLTAGKTPHVQVDGKDFVWHAEHHYDKGFSADDLKEVEPFTDDYAPVETMYRPVKKNEYTQRQY
ncbi:MAG: fused MFS/spermidine synthase [Planctomycetota bacterium]|nr:fused MFS/spermidine synthase [Planctomycetota bacterium]